MAKQFPDQDISVVVVITGSGEEAGMAVFLARPGTSEEDFRKEIDRISRYFCMPTLDESSSEPVMVPRSRKASLDEPQQHAQSEQDPDDADHDHRDSDTSQAQEPGSKKDDEVNDDSVDGHPQEANE